MENVTVFDFNNYFAGKYSEDEIQDMKSMIRLDTAMKADATFGEKMQAQESIEDIYELSKDIVGLSFERFESAYKHVNDVVNEFMFENKETGRLTEESLDMVAGGGIIGMVFWSLATLGCLCSGNLAGVVVSGGILTGEIIDAASGNG